MASTPKIFLAYCYPDKKWLDRLQAVIAPFLGGGNTVAWDERKFRFSGNLWRTELPQLLSTSKVAVLLVSDLFLDSDFFVRANLTALLHEARSSGLEVRWILLSHCLHQEAGLDPALALNDLDWPLDGLSTVRREAVLADIGRRIKALSNGDSTPPVPALELASPGDGAPSRYTLPLGAMIEGRERSVRALKNLARCIWPLAIVLGIGAVAFAISQRSLTLFVLLAGFALFIASLVLVLRARAEYLAQSIIGVRCVRTGLADTALPERQRADLARRATEMLGGI